MVLLRMGIPEPEVRAATFVALVASNFALIMVNRSFGTSIIASLMDPNRAYWLMLISTMTVLSAALLIEPVRELFHFGPVRMSIICFAIGMGLAVMMTLELWKKMGPGLQRGAC